MPWRQLSLTAARDQAPMLAAALENAGALAVTFTDPETGPETAVASAPATAIWEPAPATVALWEQVQVTALFAADPTSQRQAEAAALALAGLSLTAPRWNDLDDQVWEQTWRNGFAPRRFGQRLWVCPRGQTTPDPNAVVVQLDPGLAFGTGQHPSTALCLSWLDRTPLAGCRVLDFGCGSGILAIAALKLGAASAVAIDHDPQALEATATNAVANQVRERLLIQSPAAATEVLAEADVLVANILARPLIELAPTLSRAVVASGRIALAGLLVNQAAAVAAAYRDWFDLAASEAMEDWVLLSGQRRSDSSPGNDGDQDDPA
ncbi:MAG: 50S ribosomal protein L11 methyltransferase [Chromatiaceae bacterium]|nr:MAG: 50S ribosomal protein L11 methyltransferase [Chromatiaceae bacterium]